MCIVPFVRVGGGVWNAVNLDFMFGNKLVDSGTGGKWVANSSMRRLEFMLCMLLAVPMLSAGLVVLVLFLQVVVGVAAEDTAVVVGVPCAGRAVRCAAAAVAITGIEVVLDVTLTQAAEAAAAAAAIVAGTRVNLVAKVVRFGGLCVHHHHYHHTPERRVASAQK